MDTTALEIRLHGRGGQGTVTMAALLVDAAHRGGWHVLGFPSFGTERTGAPVAAFVRLARTPIFDRSEVRHPSVVVVQDPTLLAVIDPTEGMLPGGTLVLNAATAPEIAGADVVTVPATELANRYLGKPVTSTAMLGALSAATKLIAFKDLSGAIVARFRGDIAAANIACARAALEAVRRARSAA